MPARAIVTRRRLLIAALAGACGIHTVARAATSLTIEGQTFPGQAQVAGHNLVLNGVGLRAVAWVKGYAAGLYLPERSSAVPQVLAMPGPKRLQLRLMLEAPANELTKALKKGIARNLPPEQQAALQTPLQRLGELFNAVGTVRPGDVVDLDQDPTRGVLFSLNGKLRGQPVASDGLFNALLLSFLGERPYDKHLKAGLLGLANR
jgi:hypothetical protein